ncbi:MAG: transposase, partial [Candidatus Omnitrophica bacterium]|nr:transposase [Candidatus Omnitrophota bacterium]
MDILERISKNKIKGYLTINERVIFEGASYHITQRAPGRELLFLEDGDYLRFLKILKETVEKFEIDLFCFSLLPNHLHLFAKINKKNLSEFTKNLFERYAKYFNLKYQRKGHVFCGRYRASFCNDEKYFLAISLYIHLNPFKAGLCKNLKDYRWSSFNLYAYESKNTFVNFEEVLCLLDPHINKARGEYLR